MLDVKKLMAKLLTSLRTLRSDVNTLKTRIQYDVDEHSISFTQTKGTQSTYTNTFSKSGYYPVGIVGWSLSGTGVGQIVLYTCHISSASKGSVTIRIGVRNNNTNTDITGSVIARVLWQKQ